MPTEANIYGVILAGGTGTRLWPASRKLLPKHLAALIGDETLLEATANRLVKVIPPDRIMTVTNGATSFEVNRQLSACHPSLTRNVLLEPLGKNTLPAVAWAVTRIYKLSPDAIVAVFPSDHIINDADAFQKDLQKALACAVNDYLVTFGIVPNAPETGYGYIKKSIPLDIEGCHQVSAFVEKPSLETAKQYVTSRGYLWNSGIFVFKAATFLDELKKVQPEMAAAMEEIASLPSDSERLAALYAAIKGISIDYGIMEQAPRVAVVSATFGWSDLGSWDAFYEFFPKNADRNVVEGNVYPLNTHDCLLFSKSQGRHLATIGIQNLTVVQTDDVTLIADRACSQDVKILVDRLQEIKSPLVETPTTVSRPWGQFTVLEEKPGYKIKRIVVSPGQKLSLQRHEHRAEHWVVIHGIAQVTNGDSQYRLKESESTFIPMGQKHRLENPETHPLVIIEVQTGEYLGEDDIQRFDDAYGRTRSKRQNPT